MKRNNTLKALIAKRRTKSTPLVSLSKSERNAIKREITTGNYGRKACAFAGINFRTFRKAIDSGHPIKPTQREKLLKFSQLAQQLRTEKFAA